MSSNALVEVSGFNEIVAAELFLRLRKRAIGGRDLSASYPNRGCGGGGLKPVVSEKATGFLDLVSECEVLAMDLLELSLWQLLRN